MLREKIEIIQAKEQFKETGEYRYYIVNSLLSINDTLLEINKTLQKLLDKKDEKD